MVKEYVKNEWKGVLAAITVSMALLIGYSAYIIYIGSAITQSRSLYNQGLIKFNDSNYVGAQKDLVNSNKLWWMSDTQKLLDRTDNIIYSR